MKTDVELTAEELVCIGQECERMFMLLVEDDDNYSTTHVHVDKPNGTTEAVFYVRDLNRWVFFGTAGVSVNEHGPGNGMVSGLVMARVRYRENDYEPDRIITALLQEIERLRSECG